jgi:hypothetical protein
MKKKEKLLVIAKGVTKSGEIDFDLRRQRADDLMKQKGPCEDSPIGSQNASQAL